MRFHRGSFYIHKVNDELELKTHWLNEDETIGFHKICRKSGTTYAWRATDTKSGLAIVTAPTRKACVEWIEQNIDKIEAKRATKEYGEYVKFMERTVK